MKELVAEIAKALVDYPDQVVVNEIKGTQSTIFELRVAKEDVGKVIGRKGKTALAIRTILFGVSAKMKNNYILEIIE
ncbi:MAG: KH domain-containing protein [Desulfobacterales bacterium]|jgi:predicted RNA-binding protein YlqC (UPF0109 family)|nr:KH domain-containing protein [Desulfobacterales bacterium]